MTYHSKKSISKTVKLILQVGMGKSDKIVFLLHNLFFIVFLFLSGKHALIGNFQISGLYFICMLFCAMLIQAIISEAKLRVRYLLLISTYSTLFSIWEERGVFPVTSQSDMEDAANSVLEKHGI